MPRTDEQSTEGESARKTENGGKLKKKERKKEGWHNQKRKIGKRSLTPNP